MKSFDEIYEELKLADNKLLNEKWNKTKNKNKKTEKTTKIICLISTAIILVIVHEMGMKIDSLFLLCFLLAMLIFANLMIIFIMNLLFMGNDLIEYNQMYKKFVIEKIMKNFFDNLEYFPQKSIPEYIYEDAKYNEYYDEYESEDYFEAQINNENSIQLGEVLTQKEVESESSSGHKTTRMVTKFHGVFAKIEMNKSINCELRILQNGSVASSEKLNMDSTEFETLFDVQSSNKIIGMQILTADVMERLLQFQKENKIEFDIIIKNNNLYLRFHSDEMFEASSLKKEMLDKRTIKKYFNMLKFVYDLSNSLIKIVDDTLI